MEKRQIHLGFIKIAKLSNPILQTDVPGIYALPLDNMPCIVPNTKELAVMPNAFKSADAAVAAIIPNGVKLRSPSTQRRVK